MRQPVLVSRSSLAQARTLRALGHPVRIEILTVLRGGEQCVCHIEAILGLRQSCISQHLRILREAGIVEVRRDGWNVFYHVCSPRVLRLVDALLSEGEQGGPVTRRILTNPRCPCPKCSSKMPRSRRTQHAAG